MTLRCALLLRRCTFLHQIWACILWYIHGMWAVIRRHTKRISRCYTCKLQFFACKISIMVAGAPCIHACISHLDDAVRREMTCICSPEREWKNKKKLHSGLWPTRTCRSWGIEAALFHSSSVQDRIGGRLLREREREIETEGQRKFFHFLANGQRAKMKWERKRMEKKKSISPLRLAFKIRLKESEIEKNAFVSHAAEKG